MTLGRQILFALVTTCFLYSLKFKIARKTLLWLTAACIVGIVALLGFIVFETYMLYNHGYTFSSDARLLIHFVAEPEDAYDPILKLALVKNKSKYEMIAEHKYAGSYQVWICEDFIDDCAKAYPRGKVFISLRIKDVRTDKERYTVAENSELWARQMNYVSCQCMEYSVPNNCRLREKVKLEVTVANTNEILESLPNAYVMIRYGHHK